MERAIREDWPVRQALIEANDDRDLLGRFVMPTPVATAVRRWFERKKGDHVQSAH